MNLLYGVIRDSHDRTMNASTCGNNLVHSRATTHSGDETAVCPCGIQAHKQYEFRVKVSFEFTHKEGLVARALSRPRNPNDGHTLEPQLRQVDRVTGHFPRQGFVDKSFHGIEIGGCGYMSLIYWLGYKAGSRSMQYNKCKTVFFGTDYFATLMNSSTGIPAARMRERSVPLATSL